MFNQYEIKGDTTELIIGNSDKRAIISTSDIEKLEALGYSFTFHKKSGYICTTLYLGPDGNKKAIMKHENIQTLIIGRENIPDGCNVDHINHDVFDNRRENLRVVKYSDNSCNRDGPNKNNKSGYRNVFWNKSIEKWSVSLCKNGKQINGGSFDDVHDAGAMAERLRKQYYGDFSGEGSNAYNPRT